jgi:hypothetical protein
MRRSSLNKGVWNLTVTIANPRKGYIFDALFQANLRRLSRAIIKYRSIEQKGLARLANINAIIEATIFQNVPSPEQA